MKQLSIILLLLAFVTISCNNSAQKQRESATEESKDAMVNVETKVLDADTLYTIAESLVDQPITIRGYVTHTCKHAGKRCFITGEEQKHSIRVEAKGEIGGFNRELEGSQLQIDGILRERRLSESEIADMESDVNEKLTKEDGSAETCAAELANINEMKEWMKTQGKDYYSIYYIDGLNYKEIEN